MIPAIIKACFTALRRDRAGFVLSFVVPVVFFSIFGIIFGGTKSSGTARTRIVVVDEDRSEASQRLVQGLICETALEVSLRPSQSKDGPVPPDYTAVTAEEVVRKGEAAAALVIPKGFGLHPVAFLGGGEAAPIQVLHDSADPVAAPLVSGLLQKTVMTSLTDVLAGEGMKYFETAVGGLSEKQRTELEISLQGWNRAKNGATAERKTGEMNLVNFKVRDVVGEHKKAPMISFYAAGIGVMFLLFTANATGGALLDEAESGALERVLCSRVSMTMLLLGKLFFNTLLASAQLLVMFVWAAIFFHLELLSHLAGFAVMTLSTALAVSAFGLLLASLARTRSQLGAIGTLLTLTMSAVGGSMFPRFFMPPIMQKIGLLTFNAWSIDGFTKVFWRDEPLFELWPQVTFLLGCAAVVFLLARHFARRWEAV